MLLDESAIFRRALEKGIQNLTREAIGRLQKRTNNRQRTGLEIIKKIDKFKRRKNLIYPSSHFTNRELVVLVAVGYSRA